MIARLRSRCRTADSLSPHTTASSDVHVVEKFIPKDDRPNRTNHGADTATGCATDRDRRWLNLFLSDCLVAVGSNWNFPDQQCCRDR